MKVTDIYSHFSPLAGFPPGSSWLDLYFSTRKECCSHGYHEVWATQEQ